MNPDQPTEYAQLTPEEAAQVDAVCDRFERAWKETKSGAPAPSLTSYLDQGHGPAREALIRELIALERACRERYGVTVQPEDSKDLGAEAEAQATAPTRRICGVTDVPAALRTGWPSVPGLELMSVLGSGGMGVVYKARQATLDRDVAVKFLRDAHRGDSEQRERFLREARTVARLRHPNLVQLYEFGEAPSAGGATSQPYLVLEYVSGGSLADQMRGSPQPPEDAARLVETLAEAIHYAHQQGVIHRDLKPANILLQRGEVKGNEQTRVLGDPRPSPPPPLTADLCVKITDFGLAKFLTGGDLTHSGYVLGTPSYVAPEQVSKSERLTAAVDIYGLGTILYEALTGRPPFAAATVEETLCQVRQDEPVPPRRLQPTVPRDLETICLKCLRKQAGNRYATAQDLANDLRRFRAGEPVRARPVGSGERVVAWCRRKPTVAALLAGIVAVTLLGIAATTWQWRVAKRQLAAADARWALQEAVDAKDQSAVIFHAGRGILAQPQNPEWFVHRGSAHAELGQWDEARADFGQAAHLSPDKYWFWYCHAIAYLGAGDTAGYHAVCTRMIQRFANTPQATHDCLYACAPDRLADTYVEQLVAMGKAAVAESKADWPILRAHAAALFRAGQDREAIQYWEEAAKVYPLRAWDWLFLTMAYHRLGETTKAQDYLARAKHWIATAGDAATKGSKWVAWLEQTEVQALRREAETLLDGTR
jgi:tetratricopeptide (TPR) repeat protein